MGDSQRGLQSCGGDGPRLQARPSRNLSLKQDRGSSTKCSTLTILYDILSDLLYKLIDCVV